MSKSDIGVAIHKSVFSRLSYKVKKFLAEADESYIHDGGDVLYIFRDFEDWDPNGSAKLLYAELFIIEDRLEIDDGYSIVTVCKDKPSEDNGSGLWFDNPWNLCREFRLSFREPECCNKHGNFLCHKSSKL